MNFKKILGVSVASLGVVASFGAAIALYTNTPSDASFNFGAKWEASDGEITYKINDAGGSGTATPSYLKADGTNGGAGLGGDYTQVHYSFKLGAVYSDKLIAQDYVLGNFSLSLTNINSALQNKSKIWMGIDGYEEKGTEGSKEYSYGYKTYHSIFMNADTAITEASYSNNKDVVVATAGVQTVNVYIKLDEAVSGETLIALNEGKLFDLSVTWTGASDSFVSANIVGNATQWKEDEKYAMLPNIGKYSDTCEWMFKGLPGTMAKAKAKKGETWSKSDIELDSTKTYDVYWDGSATSDGTWTPQA